MLEVFNKSGSVVVLVQVNDLLKLCDTIAKLNNHGPEQTGGE